MGKYSLYSGNGTPFRAIRLCTMRTLVSPRWAARNSPGGRNSRAPTPPAYSRWAPPLRRRGPPHAAERSSKRSHGRTAIPGPATCGGFFAEGRPARPERRSPPGGVPRGAPWARLVLTLTFPLLPICAPWASGMPIRSRTRSGRCDRRYPSPFGVMIKAGNWGERLWPHSAKASYFLNAPGATGFPGPVESACAFLLARRPRAHQQVRADSVAMADMVWIEHGEITMASVGYRSAGQPAADVLQWIPENPPTSSLRRGPAGLRKSVFSPDLSEQGGSRRPPMRSRSSRRNP